MMSWLTRIFQAIAALLGIDVAGAVTSANLRRENDDIRLKLVASISAAGLETERFAAIIAERDHLIEELTREIEAHTQPGDVLRRRTERMRDLSRRRPPAGK